jgi:hypothetical protein
MMSDLICPSCGSRSLRVEAVSESRQLTLGSEFSYKVPIHVCDECGEEIDFTDGGEEKSIAFEKARKDLANSLIDGIQSSGMRLSYVERAFELPQRTISSKWRSGISASGLALLRIVSTMPWVVNIADAKFAPQAIGYEISRMFSESGVEFKSEVGDKNRIEVRVTTAQESEFQQGPIKSKTKVITVP